ncbi:MAG: cytochrome-c peroxidase [Labilithrix sp.]|nr:cytochrome-c peroxidase [Labilithrix sp.]MCW5833909.1 cytochrome-c peroxidase [Labilithrix sp.]
MTRADEGWDIGRSWARARRTRRLLVGVPLVLAACSSARDDASPLPTTNGSPGAAGPQPELGALVEQAEPPPPISGGTLAIDREDGVAVAADSDRDRVYVVDLPSRAVRHVVALAPRSEPGRVALDGSGRAHVLLRNTGELATIDLATGGVTLRAACTAPRGVAFDARQEVLYVACANGDLLTFPVAGGPATRRSSLGRDLRDVVLLDGQLTATRFRSAELVTVSAEGAASQKRGLGSSNLAWRAVAAPVEPSGEARGEEAAVVTQDPTAEPVSTEPGAYGATASHLACATPVGVVSTRLWLVDARRELGSVRLPAAVLPVDVATNGREFAVVAAGNAFTPSLPQLFVVHRDQLANGTRECVGVIQGDVPGQAVAADFDHKDELVVQTREPAALHIMTDDRRRPWKTIVLSTESRHDTGHAIFHANAGGSISCASCHAEGADDGRTWEFVAMGPRRTPSLLGTTLNTEPFHWDGDMKDLSTLVDHVFVERMGGPKIDQEQVGSLGHYLFTLPAPPKLRDPADVPAQGKQLFEQRCASCHSGPLLTNNQSIDVGTGGTFQVPSLVGIGWRAPFLHTGCATTLFDRFDPACGGDKHGEIADLTKVQIADLVAHIESL